MGGDAAAAEPARTASHTTSPPVRHVASLDTRVAHASQLKREILPEPEDIVKAREDIRKY